MAEWSPELTLNHELLDEQHVGLFRRLEEAAVALDAGAAAAVRSAVAGFADALLEHLAAEEALMEETLYPERTRHKAAHELFTADLTQMRGELELHGPTPAVADWIRTRAPEWLRFHIRVNDLPFGAHLARRSAPQQAPERSARRRPAPPKRLS
ncbi:MAG TPA: hemerythrin family protein [Anaeromyxobacteraceae bacterium]|nr:hemerythrin family protein [Anaeromyxobacteraceae bacterium]